MDKHELRLLRGFYRNELKNELLSFWMPRCLDEKYGGFLNCFSNDGKKLVSHDKYTWSQGRFVWMWSKLASLKGDTFSSDEKAQFLKLAKNGRDFLYEHCLLGKDDWRCTFLMDETGAPKYVEGSPALDMSISADGFVILGFAKYAEVTGDVETWEFVKKLYDSVRKRYKSGNFFSLPYPLSSKYVCHGTFMFQTCLANEMYNAAIVMEPELAEKYKNDSKENSDTVFNTFVDKNNSLHEIVFADKTPAGGIFGQHMNPGHTIEDMWFQVESSDITGANRIADIEKVALRAFDIGWDYEMGGFYHFVDTQNGGEPTGSIEEGKNEPQLKLVLGDWGSKLWWVHSEALYTSLLLFFRTGNEKFLEYYKKTEDYTYSTFPNPDKNIREWIQIRTRESKPQDKVVALPVKDPFHIIRNVALIIELLENEIQKLN